MLKVGAKSHFKQHELFLSTIVNNTISMWRRFFGLKKSNIFSLVLLGPQAWT